MSRRPRRWRRSREERAERRRAQLEKLKKGIFILPALITVANFGSGFLSILFTMEDRYIAACWMIVLAMFADAMDGAMARVTRTESAFGKQLDSLADVVSFGCAPALMLYQRFDLSQHPFWIFPLFFATAGALRLARYTAIDSETTSRDFRGTPIPAPAGIIVGLILLLEHDKSVILDRKIVIIAVFTLSYLMLSNIRYPSIKMIHNPEKPHPFRSLVLLMLMLVMLFYRFIESWLILGAMYYLSGPVLGIRNRLMRPALHHEPEKDEIGYESLTYLAQSSDEPRPAPDKRES